MFVFFAATVDQAQTLQSSIDTFLYLRIIITILLIFGLLVGILSWLFYLVTKHSPDLTFNFLVPGYRFGKKNIHFDLENDLGRPLELSKLTIFCGEKIYKNFYFMRNNFWIHLPSGTYRATAMKFGHTASSTDVFRVSDQKLDFDLRLHRTEEVRPSKMIHNLALTAMICNGVLAIAAIVALFQNYGSLTLAMQIVLLALFALSAYLTSRFFEVSKGLELVNFKNQPLQHKEVAVTNRFNEPIENLDSDKNGILYAVIAPGTYKFAPEDHDHRTVRVNEVEFAHFKIKF